VCSVFVINYVVIKHFLIAMNRLERKKKMIALLILRHVIIDGEYEEYMIHEHWNLRKNFGKIYNRRENEGIFKMLINNHLVDEEQRFKSYFRVTRETFAYILSQTIFL
jgi:hypothetical protein